MLLCACGHAQPAARAQDPQQAAPDAGPPPPDPAVISAQLSEETHALLRAEGELLWQRWTTGAGPLPASALAAHPALLDPRASWAPREAAARATGPDQRALQLLAHELALLGVPRDATDALERARAQLVFAAPGDQRPERGERDLDKLLTEEPSAVKRAGVALAEARAAGALAPLALARDAAVEKADWAGLQEQLHGVPLAQLGALAEQTLLATEAVAARAVASAAVRNLGLTSDRLRRADLPRLVRTAQADAEFPAGRAWPAAQKTFAALGLELVLRVDAEPSPSKGARPLALLVDPPADVRLSLRPAGGFDEQRSTLHEAARAAGGVLTRTPRWELAQLGDGAAAEGVAQLFEELCGNPAWLRDNTALRGEPLDDLVHTLAARRLLSARRAAALVLFELKRRGGPRTAEAQAALYRGLIQRATFAALSNDDAGRWALEADDHLRTAPLLLGALLAAQLEAQLAAPWWQAPQPALRKLWEGGRAQPLPALDPALLAQVAQERLSYVAPDAPPATPKPDYKYMQGDKKRRKKRKP